MDKEQLIQGYIANTLSQADKEIVEKLLKTDADFKVAFELHNDVAMAYKVSESQILKERFQKIELQRSKNNLFGISKIGYSAIASILIIGFFYIFNSDPSGKDLYTSNFTIYPNTYQPVTRDITETENSNAFMAYENKDFQNAEVAFEEILKTSENPNIRFYYAMTLLNTAKFDQALAQLNQLQEVDFDYKEEVLWYTALIYLQKEDIKNAKTSLETLDRLNSRFKSDERTHILEELED